MIWNPFCSTLLAPKEMLWVGLGIFILWKLLLQDGFNDKRMGRKWQELLDPFQGGPTICQAPSPHWHPLVEEGWCSGGSSHQFPLCFCLQITKTLWNQRHLHRPASILCSCLCVKMPEDTLEAGGLWNHILIMIQNLFCPNPMPPKRDASSIFVISRIDKINKCSKLSFLYIYEIEHKWAALPINSCSPLHCFVSQHCRDDCIAWDW